MTLEERGYSKIETPRFSSSGEWWQKKINNAYKCEINNNLYFHLRRYELPVYIATTINTYEIEIVGEYKNIWYKMTAYTLRDEDLNDLEFIENNLYNMWQALHSLK